MACMSNTAVYCVIATQQSHDIYTLLPEVTKDILHGLLYCYSIPAVDKPALHIICTFLLHLGDNRGCVV